MKSAALTWLLLAAAAPGVAALHLAPEASFRAGSTAPRGGMATPTARNLVPLLPRVAEPSLQLKGGTPGEAPPPQWTTWWAGPGGVGKVRTRVLRAPR